MKDKSLRVLIIEDSEDDALLVIRKLKKDGYNPVYERVETAAAMKKALKEKQWDIILCDYKMPKFNAPSAIALLKETNIDIPIIIVSGTIGEDEAIECMRSGAQDYIMKGNLSRLCPAVARELEEAKARKKQRQSEFQREKMLESLHQNEEKYRTILESIQEGYFEVDLAGNFIFCNDSMYRLTGCPKGKLLGMSHRHFTDKETSKEVFQAFNKVYKTGEPSKGFDWQIIREDGTKSNVEASASLQKDSSGKPIGFKGILRDISERKKAEETLRESEERYRALFDRSLDLVYVIDFEGLFIDANDTALNRLGYKREDLRTVYITQLLSEDQLPLAIKTIQDVRDGILISPVEFRLQQKNGSYVYVETQGSIIMSHGTPVAIQAVARDITERKRAEEKLQRTLDSLRKAFGATIKVMVSAVEMRDPYTAGHQIRAADIARAIATEMGLAQEKIDGIRMAGTIHDIGKLSIPAEILSKPTKLTDIEFSLIKEHSHSGYEMLKDVESPWPLAEIVHQHHERMNGTGYPRNLQGDEILMEARILAVADVVEAMASHRPYRASLGIEVALEEIEKNKGILYDDAVANACLKLFREKGYQLT